jgi:hypothetical protein
MGKLTIRMVWPNAHRGEAEIILLGRLDTREEILDFLDRRAQVLCAGVMAEATIDGVCQNHHAVKLMQAGGGADQDFAKYKEVILLMRNIKYGADTDPAIIEQHLNELENSTWNKAIEVVQREFVHIEGLAGRLASGVRAYHVTTTLSPEELETIPALQERFGEPGSHTQ